MIRLSIAGKNVTTEHHLSLTFELNNALLSGDDVDGDFSYTFTIPVQGNEKVLEFGHLPQIKGVDAVPCTVHGSGDLGYNGLLVFQKIEYDKVHAALILNPYPSNFGQTLLNENQDEEIVISPSLSVHNIAWKRFLQRSIYNKDVKFAPFFNETGYGSENDSYGYWHGIRRPRIVNAIFFDGDGNLVDSAVLPFSKTNNETFDLSDGEDKIEDNQLAFCPQIRLARILKIWCNNAGYSFVNHLGKDLNETFLQSQRSLDGSMAQYGASSLIIKTDADQWVGSYLWCNSFALEGHSQDAYVHDGKVWLQESGWWAIKFSVEYRQNDTTLGQAIPDYSMVYVKAYVGDHNIHEIHNGDGVILDQSFSKPQDSHVHASKKIYVSSGLSNQGIRFAVYIKMKQNNTSWPVKLQHVEMNITFHKLAADRIQTGFNIFRKSFSIPEMLPAISNSSFLKVLKETLGLCYFVSGKTKEIEFVPYISLLSAKSLDLSGYVLDRETETVIPKMKTQVFRLAPLTESSYDDSLRIQDFSGSFPSAYENHERFVLNTETNTLYHADVRENEQGVSVEEWSEWCGNPDTLKAGRGEEELHESADVKIPHQRFFGGGRIRPSIDLTTIKTPQLPVAEFTIISDLYNCGEVPTDLILTQYRGFRKRTNEANPSLPYIMNEVMLPVWGNDFALKARGTNSLGNKYVKPVLMLANEKSFIYKFRVPETLIPEIDRLLRPQHAEPENQVRFIMVDNIRTMPKTIRFQIDNSDDTGDVLCQIEAVQIC